MWQRFTEAARRAMYFSQGAAQRAGQSYISTEHLLLGLLREPDNLAVISLRFMGLDPGEVENEVLKHLPSEADWLASDISLTPRAKRVIDLAYDEARNLNDNFIGTEHLLLGLIREGEGLAGRVLEKFGVELEATRKKVMELHTSSQHALSNEQVETVSTSALSRMSIEAQARRERDIHFAMLSMARLSGMMTADHLCVMLICEDEEARKAIEACGGNVNSVVSIIRDRIIATKTPEELRNGFLTATELISLAAGEAHRLGQKLSAVHFLLSAAGSDTCAAASAFKIAGIHQEQIRNHLQQIGPAEPI